MLLSTGTGSGKKSVPLSKSVAPDRRSVVHACMRTVPPALAHACMHVYWPTCPGTCTHACIVAQLPWHMHACILAHPALAHACMHAYCPTHTGPGHCPGTCMHACVLAHLSWHMHAYWPTYPGTQQTCGASTSIAAAHACNSANMYAYTRAGIQCQVCARCAYMCASAWHVHGMGRGQGMKKVQH